MFLFVESASEDKIVVAVDTMDGTANNMQIFFFADSVMSQYYSFVAKGFLVCLLGSHTTLVPLNTQ